MNSLRRNTNSLASSSSPTKTSTLAAMWRTWASAILLLHVISSFGPSEAAIKNVRLIISPVPVRRTHSATIRCLYDMDIPLFSVKFYRGLREFYRYSPHEHPRNKQFPFPGINVDMTNSNESQVVIKNVGFGLGGNFSCEVTADAPLFSTGTAYGQMQVVELPSRKPTVHVEQSSYEPGDVLRANCTSPASRPRADHIITLNNQVLYDIQTVYVPGTPETLLRTETSVRLQLQSSHFGNSGQHGSPALVLRCTARIDNFYDEYSEATMRTSSKDPVPERVMYNASGRPDLIKPVLFISAIIFTLSPFWSR